MDGLDEFEKALAAEKGERERVERDKEERRQRKKSRHHHHRDHHNRDGRERSTERRRERSRDRDRDRDRDRSHHHRHHRSSKHDDKDETDRRQHRSSRHSRDEADEHRHKRSRRTRDEDSKDESYKRRRTDDDDNDLDLNKPDPKEGLPLPDDEKPSNVLERDSWMSAPSALDIDYVQRSQEKEKTPPAKEAPTRIVHEREINKGFDDLSEINPLDTQVSEAGRKITYKFGDQGSQWRMMKLKAVHTTAEQTGRSVEDVALERYGDLQDFDDAREEKIELDRRKLYGEGYAGKEQPTGELFRERQQEHGVSIDAGKPESVPKPEPEPEQGTVIPDQAMQHTPMDQTALNRLRAQMMKAKLRKAPDAGKLEAEYNQAAVNFASKGPQSVVLGMQDSRMLAGTRGEIKEVETKRGRERGNVEANEDMSIDDMVREERRTRGQAGGEGKRLAERIAKDGKFDDNLDYMDENADKLAKRIHKSEINLKNVAVNEYQKLTKILDNCPLCHHEDKNEPPLAPVVSLGTRVFLTLPTEPEVSEGGAMVVPMTHRKNLLECDDDEWEEIRNFMKSLTRMYHEAGQDVIFYENAAAPHRHLHAAMMVVPIPYEEGAMVPAYFKEAFLTSDEEWAQHRKVIDTGAKAQEGLGRMAFRRSIAKEMPYFHVWFTLDGGLGHIVENSDKWPRGDLFAREVVGGILDVAPDVIKRQGRWRRDDQRVSGFTKGWRKFDWTRVLQS